MEEPLKRMILLRVAYTPEGDPVRLLLEEHGVRLTDPGALAVPIVGVNVTDPPLIDRLLGLGADPNQTFQTVTVTIPAVALAAVAGEPATIGALAAHGANLNVAGTHGYTALMMAAAAPRPDPSIIRSLVLNSADVHARDDVGRTALDWALLQGETPAAAALKHAGARAMAPSPAPPPAVAAPRSAADAVEKAIARLQPAGPVFYECTKCISSHHQSLPALAGRMASAQGVRVDQALASHPTASTTTMWKGSREAFLLGSQAFGGFVANVGYGLLAMREERAPATPRPTPPASCWQRSSGPMGRGICLLAAARAFGRLSAEERASP
jgi:hypothetical protein